MDKRLFLLLSLLVACSPKVVQIHMDPMEILAERTDDGLSIEIMDPDILLEEGIVAYSQGEYAHACRKFTWILERFPASVAAAAARFNRGVAALADERPKDAAQDFSEYIHDYPQDIDIADAWQKLGQALTESGKWEEAEGALRLRINNWEMNLLQESQLRALLVRSLLMQERGTDALWEGNVLLGQYQKYKEEPQMQHNWFVAMAAVDMAKVHHREFSQIQFRLPVEKMEEDLVKKADLFLKAQSSYMTAMRIGNPHWGMSAGIHIGRLFEDFYDDIIKAEVPAELSQEERELYYQELQQQVRPLVVKAIRAYERYVTLFRTQKNRSHWILDAENRLEKLRKTLEEILGNE